MMANNFSITISAVDKATATVKKVNDSILRVARPITDVQRSMKALGTELGRNPAVKALSKVGQIAKGVASSVSRVAVPMAGLAGVASAGGIVALASQWGKLGLEINKTAATVGISVTDLQSWRGAAKLAGGSAEEITSGIKTLGDTLQDAAYNRNPAALEMMRILGLKLHRTASGAVDTTRAMMDLADILSSPKFKGNPQLQGLIARTFGQEANLPLLREGSAAIRAYMRDVASLGSVQTKEAIENAAQFGRNLARMGVASDGLRNSIGNALMPVLTPFIEKFTNFINTNRAPIADTIKDLGERFANWISNIKEEDWDKLKDDLKLIGDAVLSIANAVNAASDAWNRWHEKDTPGVSKGLGFRFGKSADIDEDDVRNGRKPLSGRMSGGKILGLDLSGIAPDQRKRLAYNNPALNAYASSVEDRLGLPKGILNSLKNNGERSNSDAVSPRGARGVMQFMPDTWSKYGSGDITDPVNSINAAGRYMKDLLKRYNGNIAAAITEYNGGTRQADAVMNGQKPWVAETANYLARVQAGMPATAAASPAPQKHEFTMTIQGLPSGASATIADANGGNIPVRVVSPMPTFGS